MLLSALDPALLIYKYEDWQAKEPHCFRRFEALTLHREMLREYGQKIAMTHEFAALILESFPWRKNFRDIGQLRDLRRFMLEDLHKAFHIEAKAAREVSLRPTGIVCNYVQAPEMIDEWKGLLCGCLDKVVLAELDPQIATWETACLREHSQQTILITIHDFEADARAEMQLPLVWDDDSWATQLVTQDWWPDLHRCVELHFRTNPGLRNYSGVRERPIAFECTRAFWKSVDQFCNQPHTRRSLIEAITKVVYGVHDRSLGLERLGETRRFRVTGFWRVHCRKEDDRLLLEEFGPHDMGRRG